MKLLTKIKTAMTVAIIAGTLGFTSTVSAHNEQVENYLSQIVKAHVAETKAEIANQAEEQVLTASYRFEPAAQAQEALVAKVTVTFLTEAQAKENGAE